MTAYRPEIDGLRALAVVPVILFHAGLGALSGGYVGVDVFFVISGYLITSICLVEMSERRFSLWRFIERRARRILPCLFVVMAACVPVGWALMLPDPFENFGQSVVASALSANNILLYLTSGYWDLAAEFKPLLHTWSLAVEEQFYILFPPLLWLLVRTAPRAVLPVLALVALASFVACEIVVARDPSAAFYLLPFRAFELLAGSLIAVVGHRRGGALFAQSRLADPLALLGLALVLLPMVTYSEETLFPSRYTLAPVLGTGLVILFAGTGTRVGRFLGLRGLVAIGLISYSLYLWHQPVFAFARIASVEEPATAVMLALVVPIFLLSVLSYRFVERPFRDRRAMPLRVMVPALGLGAAALTVAGLAVTVSGGVPARAYGDGGQGMYISYNDRIFGYRTAAFPEDGRQNVLVLGNSVARDFSNMLLESGAVADRNIVYRDRVPTCYAAEGLAGVDPELAGLMRAADVIFLPSTRLDRIDCVRGDAAFLERLGATVWVPGLRNFGYNLNPYMRVPQQERRASCSEMTPGTAAANMRIAEAAGDRFIDLVALLAVGPETCVRVFDDGGRFLSADRAHLTEAGARFLGDALFGEDGPLADF